MRFGSKSWHLCFPGSSHPLTFAVVDQLSSSPCQRERTAGHQPSRPGIFKVSLFRSDLLWSDNQRLGEESKAAWGSSPWHRLTHSGILTGGKNISLAFSAGCCHRLSFQDPVSLPRASAASSPVHTPPSQGSEPRSPSPKPQLAPHLQLPPLSPWPGASKNALKSH